MAASQIQPLSLELESPKVPYDLSAVLMDSGPVPKDDFQRVWQNQSVQKAGANRSAKRQGFSVLAASRNTRLAFAKGWNRDT